MTPSAPRRWLVTGASRGIGLAIAERAHAAGDRVALLARSGAVDEHAARLGAGRAEAVRADVTDPAGLGAAVAALAERWGGLDVVVNNAALHRGGRIDRLERDDFLAVLGANLTGPFDTIRAALPYLGAGASIVNVGAVVGFRGFPGDTAYGTAKAGLAGLTTVLAVELARKRIRVNLVAPGFVETEMTSGLSDRAKDMLTTRIPLGRPGTAQEMADVVFWVAGATYMTGSVVCTDGGLMAALGSAG